MTAALIRTGRDIRDAPAQTKGHAKGTAEEGPSVSSGERQKEKTALPTP